MSPDQPFEVLVINLDRSPDRWTRISADLAAQSLAASRVPAVDGKGKDPHGFPEFDAEGYALCHGRVPMATEVGCYLSHVRALRQFLAGNAQHCVILEDDAALAPDFADCMRALVNTAADWDMLLLYGAHGGGPVPLKEIETGHVIAALTFRQCGSSGYIINRACAAILADRLIPMRVPLDHAFTLPWIHGLRMRACLPYPIPTTMAAAGSTIGWDERQRPSLWKRLCVLWYRTRTEVGRVWHYLTRDPVIWKLIPRKLGLSREIRPHHRPYL